jgi:hypothetical protein
MPEGSVKIVGLKELDRAFGKVDGDLRTELRVALKEAAAIVAADASARAERYGSKTAGGIKPLARTGYALVRQTIGGKRIRPAFGSVLMKHSLLPALEANQEKVVARLERMLDEIGAGAGF